MPVVEPARIAYAAAVAAELYLVRAVPVADENLPAGAVFLDGGVAHAVEYAAAVRGHLRVGQPAQREQVFGAHPAVRVEFRRFYGSRAIVIFLCHQFQNAVKCECQYQNAQEAEHSGIFSTHTIYLFW